MNISENTFQRDKSAKKKIEQDCKDIWSERTIREYIPKEAKNEKQSETVTKTNQRRALEKMATTAISKTELVEPPALEQSETIKKEVEVEAGKLKGKIKTEIEELNKHSASIMHAQSVTVDEETQESRTLVTVTN